MAMQAKNKIRQQQRFQGHTQTSYMKHQIIAKNQGNLNDMTAVSDMQLG